MRKIRVTAKFKKDLKKADKNPRQDTSKLKPESVRQLRHDEQAIDSTVA